MQASIAIDPTDTTEEEDSYDSRVRVDIRRNIAFTAHALTTTNINQRKAKASQPQAKRPAKMMIWREIE